MTDYTGLKRLCAALISANEAYLDDSCSLENQERFHAADDALQDALPPEVVLAIIAENELLRESPGMGAIRSLRGDCADLMAECDRLKAENEGLRKEREGKVLVSVAPSDGLLMSMAIRSDHALGCPGYYDQKGLGRPNNGVSHARMLECALGDMRKLHEEVVGAGFYSPEKEADYQAMAKAAQP